MRLRVDEYGRIARLHDRLMNPGGIAGKPEASAKWPLPAQQTGNPGDRERRKAGGVGKRDAFKLLQPCHDSATILI